MKNYEIDATWQYHNGTKHPNGILLSRSHTYHPASRPTPYKNYKNATQIKIALDKQPSGISALDAISDKTRYKNLDFIPDIKMLSKILYFSGGITKTLKFSPPLGEIEFRAASCTGALYHIEMYIVCSDILGLGAGVYHFDPKNFSLTALRKGDYRKIIADATANEPFASSAPVSLIFTDIFSRNSVKYQAREYRHAFWDCGTILSNSLAMTSVQKMPYKLILGFVDSKINSLLGLDTKKEVALAILSLGRVEQEIPDPPQLDKIAESEPFEYDCDFVSINEMHESSSLTDIQEVSAWRRQMSPIHQTSLNPIKMIGDIHVDESVEQTIIRRGSTRKFSHDCISLEQLSTILKRSTNGFVADFQESNTINDVYIIANAVDGLEQGSYFYNKKDDSLELLQKGNFRDMSGHLGLDQSLPYDASVTIFFMVDLQKILEHFGNRGYRVAQLDASIAAGRMYLAAYALHIGATGLTFYDDTVTEFFLPHAGNKNTMFMLAIGKKTKRETSQ
ncbi:MAG: SagB/ThcOx family dehydrogenase [Nitrosotalea sp.]